MNPWDGLLLEGQPKKGENTTKKKQRRVRSISKLAPQRDSLRKEFPPPQESSLQVQEQARGQALTFAI